MPRKIYFEESMLLNETNKTIYTSAQYRGIENKYQSCPPIFSCPFCGAQARLIEGDPWGHDLFAVMCSKCRSMSDFYDSPSKAIEAWNKRMEQ